MNEYPSKAFFGGFNDNLHTSLVPDHQFIDCNNVRVLDDGSVDQRTGYANLLTSAETSTIIAQEQIEIGSSRYEIFATKSDIKLKSGSASSSLLSGLNGIDYGMFHQWNDKVFFSNGIDNIKKTSLNENNVCFVGSTDLNGGFLILKLSEDLSTIKKNIDFNGTFYHGQLLCLNKSYIYAVDDTAKVIYKYNFNLDLIASVSISPVTAIGNLSCNENYVAIRDSQYIYVYDSNLSSYGSIAVTALSEEYGCCMDSTYIYNFTGSSITRYLISTLSSVTTIVTGISFAGRAMAVNSSYLFLTDAPTGKKIYVYSKTSGTSIGSITTPSTFGYYRGSIFATDNYIYTVPHYLEKTMYKYDMTLSLMESYNFIGLGYSNTNLIGCPVFDVLPYSEWYDLCSPYKPIPNVLSDAGSCSAASITYRSTWYNTTTELETSGGLSSSSVSAASKEIEVFFDFNLDSQITKDKADDLLVTHHRLYRKEGTADFKLEGTYPIYFTLNGAITSSATSCVVDDAKSVPVAENFYILIDDELILVTAAAVSGNSFATITRAQKGTTSASHVDDSTVYMFSIIDNVATGSLGSVCPIQNDYVPVAKYITNHKERLVLANSSEYPSRVWYSSYNELGGGDEDRILEDNWYDCATDDGTVVNGITVHQDNVLIGKDRSQKYLTGDLDTASMIDFSDHYGIASQKSIIPYGTGFFSLSYSGIMFTLGQLITNLTKHYIPNLIKSINCDYAYKAHGCIYEKYNELWMFVPTGSNTDCDTAIVMNINLSELTNEKKAKCWYKFTFPSSVTSSAIIVDSNGDDILWTGISSTSSVNNIVLQDSTNYDSAATITAYVEKIFNSAYDKHKKYRRIWTDLLGQSSVASVALSYDTGDGVYTSSNISMNFSGRSPKKVSFSGQNGNYIKTKWTNSNAGIRFRIFNHSIDWKGHKIR